MPLRVLLITPRFYGIEKKIKFVLEESGFEVQYIENRILRFDYHSRKSKFNFLRKLYFFFFFPQVKYLRKELKGFQNTKFDVLFAIDAFIICPYIFRTLKNNNPDLYSILYLWDSFLLYNWEKEIKYFNKVLTFDQDDSTRYDLEYKHNFFLNNTIQLKNSDEKYDLFFVGKYNRTRFVFVEEIIKSLEISGIKYFIKLWPAYKKFPHNRFVYRFLKNINFKSNWIKDYLHNYEVVEGIVKTDFITSTSLDYFEVQNVLQNSNVVLDLPFMEQDGYSHRLIEALARGKKVFTTNKKTLGERFYNPQQIRIVDLLNPEIDSDWIKNRCVFSIDKLFVDLELSVWLKSLINVEDIKK
jgi:hypothetical protein